MAKPGPPPKRSDQRRRRNKSPQEPTKAAGAPLVEQPAGKASWHPTAKRWYQSLAESGQARFYEPSDWALAYIMAESMSRDLKPRVVGITKEGDVVKESMPLTGTSMSSYLKGMTTLLVTEGDRRRAQLELHRPDPDAGGDGKPTGPVSVLDEYRNRLSSG